jgi:hypothetical protein
LWILCSSLPSRPHSMFFSVLLLRLSFVLLCQSCVSFSFFFSLAHWPLTCFYHRFQNPMPPSDSSAREDSHPLLLLSSTYFVSTWATFPPFFPRRLFPVLFWLADSTQHTSTPSFRLYWFISC